MSLEEGELAPAARNGRFAAYLLGQSLASLIL